MSIEPGQTLLHYRIVDKLGEGGMGAVYRAEDTRLGREIAIKVMPAELAADAERRRRFEQEARAVAALKHPNIVTVYSVEEAPSTSSGQAGSVLFITMELIEGRPLSALIPKGGLDLGRLFELAIPAAEALSSAHAKRITHRDLKPANMMLDADGRLKVLDFGLAKLLAPDDANDMNGADAETATQMADSAPRTEEGKILGTAAYMSPEQAEGKPVDARTDIFSLGVVLYEMATGRRPFQGDTSISTISSILKDTPPRVSELRPGLPRHLGRIVERCLEKDPAKRFQTARDIANELEGLKKEIDSGELQGGLSASSTPPSPAPRNKKLLVAGLVAGAVLIAAAAGVLWPRLQSTLSGAAATAMDDKSIAVLPFANTSDGNENEFFSDGLAEELLNRLSRVPDLRVAARTSSFHFKGHTGNVSEVAQQLNVATILEGSVRRAGDSVRVTAQLINASDGFPLWSESYDGQLDDIFGIQEKIATQVVDALKITLLGEDARRLASRPTDSVEAYEAYLLGQQRTRNRRSDELEQAVQYFQRAIDLDPGFALAYVGQAEAVGHLSDYGTLPEREKVERVRSLLETAMELDDQLGEAYAVRGVELREGDLDGAIADFERAIELNPNNAMAYTWFGLATTWTDPERSLSLHRRALELDPLSPVIHVNVAWSLERKGEYEEALKGYQRAVEIDPEYASGYAEIARLYEEAFGQFDEAIYWSERAVASDPGNLRLRIRLGNKLLDGGRFDDALEVFREAIDLAPGNIEGYRAIADLHEVRGRFDEATRWNHAAYQRDPSNPMPVFHLARLYLILGDEAAGRLWMTRLRDIEGTEFSAAAAQSIIHAKRGEIEQAEAIVRELAALNARFRWLILDFDLDAGNYDAILEREREFEPGLFEDPPVFNLDNVESAMAVGAALAGRGDSARAERMLARCEEYLLSLDESARRARLPDLLGSVYLFQGRNDEALAEWRIAFENGWRGMPGDVNRVFIEFASLAKFDPVRDDPRFRALTDDIRADLARQLRALERDGLAIAD